MAKEPTKFYKFRETTMLNTFQIRTVSACTALDNWLNASEILTDFENTTLDFALQRYHELSRGWNEEELKMHFISSVLNIVKAKAITQQKKKTLSKSFSFSVN